MKNLSKLQKIAIIKEIISDYDICSNFELNLDCSPVYASVGNIISLVEMYDDTNVTIYSYIVNTENEIDEFTVSYNDLSNKLINEIYNNFLHFQQNFED